MSACSIPLFVLPSNSMRLFRNWGGRWGKKKSSGGVRLKGWFPSKREPHAFDRILKYLPPGYKFHWFCCFSFRGSTPAFFFYFFAFQVISARTNDAFSWNKMVPQFWYYLYIETFENTYKNTFVSKNEY